MLTIHDYETRTKTRHASETVEHLFVFKDRMVYNARAYGYMLPIYYLSKMYLSILRCSVPLTPGLFVSAKMNRITM